MKKLLVNKARRDSKIQSTYIRICINFLKKVSKTHFCLIIHKIIIQKNTTMILLRKSLISVSHLQEKAEGVS